MRTLKDLRWSRGGLAVVLFFSLGMFIFIGCRSQTNSELITVLLASNATTLLCTSGIRYLNREIDWRKRYEDAGQ